MKRVAENVASWRKARQLQQKDLSARLREIGRPMLPTVISKIERGERRIDIDDLMALSVALDVSPLVLLLPRTGTGEETVLITDEVEAPAARVWQWVDGDKPLSVAENDPWGHTLRYRLDSRPEWDRDPLRAKYNDVLADTVKKLVRAGQKGRFEIEDGAMVWYDDSGRVVDRFTPEGR